ncbi:MAG TPA: L,D-transpeptidase [Gemmatimonadaceae bacterium]
MQRRSRSIIAVLSIPIAVALVFGVGAAIRGHEGSSSLTLEASLSDRKLSVMRDGETIGSYPIAIGSPTHPTPPGFYRIKTIVWNPDWIPPDQPWARGKAPAGPGSADNPMRTVKIFFREPDFYIHGTNNPKSLGEAASHGCLRMDPNQAAEVALMVMDNSGITRDWDWVKGILHIGETRAVRLQVAAPFTITN